MTARGQATGDRRQATGGGEAWFDLSPASFLLMSLVLLAVPVFAHGCHTGDHDDEPAFAPPSGESGEPGASATRWALQHPPRR